MYWFSSLDTQLFYFSSHIISQVNYWLLAPCQLPVTAMPARQIAMQLPLLHMPDVAETTATKGYSTEEPQDIAILNSGVATTVEEVKRGALGHCDMKQWTGTRTDGQRTERLGSFTDPLVPQDWSTLSDSSLFFSCTYCFLLCNIC
ncbi:hypothetical protein GOP47_0011394 [Adiantum capillus-veneris]|uniref:Uncharacterized protein n=1 Tax=Adiantum capillus-veneris TaxID=13818 RepID=A0A9D4UT72_ADICA|nr:hypothetical protein GOP47_0011394 [Adiantum capillus-veneris]